MQLSKVSNINIREKAESLMKDGQWMLALIEWESWHEKVNDGEKTQTLFTIWEFVNSI